MKGKKVDFGKPIDIIHYTDAQACPSDTLEDFDRFRALGWFIDKTAARDDLNVKAVVNGGDQGEFRSLNRFKGSTLLGGANQYGADGNEKDHDLLADITIFKKSYEAILKPSVKSGRDIEFFHTAGNHEHFLSRLGYTHKSLRSILGLEALDIKTWCYVNGIRWSDYLEPLSINGVCFQHEFSSDNHRAALSIQTVFNRFGGSSVFGHTHRMDQRIGKDQHGCRRFVLNAGTFQSERKADITKNDCGLFILKDIHQSSGNFEWIPQSKILSEFRKYEQRQQNRRGLIAA